MEDYQKLFENKTVLITGGAGAIGSNLTRPIAGLKARTVIVLDDMSAAYDWNVPSLPNVLFVRGSITDEVILKRVFGLNPDIVYHLAAFFANQNSVDYPQRDLLTNGLGTLLVYQYAQLCKTSRVVYASSGCSIYGHSAPLPLKEDFMSMHLTTPYQITKMLGELYANFFHHHHGLPIVKTRFFNSYGPGEVPGQYRNVIPNFIYYALCGMPLPFTGSGEETRDFTFVGDIVEALLRAGYFEKAILQLGRLGAGPDLARTINSLGKTFLMQGRQDAALKCCEEALAMSKLLNDDLGLAAASYNLVAIHEGMGHLDEAIALLTRVVEIDTRHGLPKLDENRRRLKQMVQKREGGKHVRI